VYQLDRKFVNVIPSACILSKFGNLSFIHQTLLESIAENDSAKIMIMFGLLFSQVISWKYSSYFLPTASFKKFDSESFFST
jgi:hypothetical protein